MKVLSVLLSVVLMVLVFGLGGCATGGSGHVRNPPPVSQNPEPPRIHCKKGRVLKHGKCVKQGASCKKGKKLKDGKCVSSKVSGTRKVSPSPNKESKEKPESDIPKEDDSSITDEIERRKQRLLHG